MRGLHHLVLADGGRVRVRSLRRGDREIYRKAVARLSPRSRFLRFGSAATMPETLLARMIDSDGQHHVAYAAFTQRETAIVGVVRYVRSAEAEGSAELALAVADDWQRRGLGSALLSIAVDRARQAGLSSLTATLLSENRGAARLLRKSGFQARRGAGIYAEYELGVGSPEPIERSRTEADLKAA
ncbi:MAG TPA: GNAT family N-acetyltransferase [Solirubrobacteraceae bacterium]